MDNQIPSPKRHTDPIRVAVIIGSVRAQRLGDAFGNWTAEHLRRRAELQVDIIDLADDVLPPDSELVPGAHSPLSDRLGRADAFVLVTPEYNHGYPASMKRVLDWHFEEWQHKVALPVGYGALGGVFAVEQLRGVCAELSLVTTRRFLAVRSPWEVVVDGKVPPCTDRDQRLQEAIDELIWWAATLRAGRRSGLRLPG